MFLNIILHCHHYNALAEVLTISLLASSVCLTVCQTVDVGSIEVLTVENVGVVKYESH